MTNSRREFIRKSVLISGSLGLKRPSGLNEVNSFSEEDDRLVLLGTQGGPNIRSYKQTPSANLIVYKKTTFVIDTGHGVTFKLKEAGINLSTLKYIFITHHHSDHNLELGPLIYNAWIAGLDKPIHVYAPIGIKQLLKYYWKSNQIDIEMRIMDEGRPDIRKLVISHEIKEGVVLSNLTEEVSALKNFHPPFKESYAFKFKLGEKIIVFSGDTTYCPALGTFAYGADYLVHEIMDAPAVEEMAKRRPISPKLKKSILSHHTIAEDVGRVATAANVKNLILNHFVPPDDKNLTDNFWTDAVSKTFSGKIIVGKDLLQLPL
ncbi:MAG: MBL fold metallo-hydrolase [Saprospiraceae bacterium]